jgi:hypothetical protein
MFAAIHDILSKYVRIKLYNSVIIPTVSLLLCNLKNQAVKQNIILDCNKYEWYMIWIRELASSVSLL